MNTFNNPETSFKISLKTESETNSKPETRFPEQILDQLFKDYPNWDANDQAPIEIYSEYHSLYLSGILVAENITSSYAKFMTDKAEFYNLISNQASQDFILELEHNQSQQQQNNQSIQSIQSIQNIQRIIEKYFTREALTCIGI